MRVNWFFIKLMKRGRENFIKNKEFREFFKNFINLEGNEKILDVGCGIGTVPRLLYKTYKTANQIYGIDLDPNLINWGQKHWGKPERIHLMQGTVYDIQFPENEFDVITSFGLIEWLEDPLKAFDEMIRVNKQDGRFITLVIEKSRFEKLPVNEKDSYFYKTYLRGIKKLGCPIEDESNYIQDLFQKKDIETKSQEFVLENKTIITPQLLELWERSYSKESYMQLIEKGLDFYFQFLKEVGWTRRQLDNYIQDELSFEKTIEFYREHLDEEMIQRTVIIALKSV